MAKNKKRQEILEGGPAFTGGASIPKGGVRQTTSELKVPKLQFSSSKSKDAVKNLQELAKKQKKSAAQKRNRKKKAEPKNKTASNTATQKRKQKRKTPAPENPTSLATKTAAKRQVQQLQSGNGARKAKAPTTANRSKSKPKKKQTKQTKPDPKTNMKFSDFGTKILLPVVGGAAAVNYGSRVLKNIMDEDKPKTVDPTPKRTGEPISKSPKSTTPKVAAPEITDPSKAKRAERDRTNIAEPKASKPKKQVRKESEDVKRRRRSQLNKPKGRAESVKEQLLIQGRRKYDTPFGKVTVDSTDEGMDTDRANFRSGGSILNKRYGMREGGFTKRGGMYKKGY